MSPLSTLRRVILEIGNALIMDPLREKNQFMSATEKNLLLILSHDATMY